MGKKRIINTIAAIVLGLSLVGVANADTIDNLMSSKGMDPQQSSSNVTQQEVTAEKQNMPDFSEVNEQTEKGVTVPTKDNETEKQDIVVQMHENMVEFHEENYEKMLEIHEIMPHNQMHEGLGVTTMGQMGQMHNGGMHTHIKN